jgi:hypothetical protein
LFDEVPELYDRVRPTYPDELFADLVAITGIQERSSVLRSDAEPAKRRAHWVDRAVGWLKAHGVLLPGGWMALIGYVVVRRPGEPEVYAETADLHQRDCPGNSDWGHPPLEDEVRLTDQGWGLVEDPGPLFGPTIVRCYPVVQWFDGAGFAALLRSTSLYRQLETKSANPSSTPSPNGSDKA